jgi:putative endonuclease
MKGGEAEQYAAEFLQRQHLVLLERNYRCRFGGIGLIMRYGVTLVFIEVRMRMSQFFGGAAASNPHYPNRQNCYAWHGTILLG